jgi:hypothetical protein
MTVYEKAYERMRRERLAYFKHEKKITGPIYRAIFRYWYWRLDVIKAGEAGKEAGHGSQTV